ncbi:choice-of-anchor A family protein [Dyadobacter sandarakinus]|nr:choice-of-anchor A family protein [Dyadobacter sandarakinus]
MAQAQSPTSAAGRFNVFIQGDATLTSSETEGPIAIGGNVTTNQYQISFNKQHGAFFVNNASIALAVRGGVKLNNGSLTINGENYVKIGQCSPADGSASNLKVWYRDNNGAASTIRITENGRQYWDSPNITINANVNSFSPAVSENVNPVCDNIFGTGDNQIDIDGAFTTFIRRSDQLREMADNLAIRDQNGNIMPNAPVGPYLDPSVIGNNPKIIVDPNKINVLTVSAAVWSRIGNSNIEGIPSGPQLGQTNYSGAFGLIVNIVDVPAYKATTGSSTVSFPGFGGLSDPQGSYVIYNFPDAVGTLTLGGNAQISGTIFAPQADLIKENNGNINGQVIAKTFRHNRDEIHFWPFLPSIPEPVQKQITVKANSKCASNAPYLDYEVAGNFDTNGQTAKIEWINAEGKVVQEDNSQPLTGSMLFPGASVDENGKGVAWPGWEKQNGKWMQVDDRYASLCNQGARIRVTVGVYQTMDITYPASSNGCYTTPPPAAPLPVKLASFTAENESCNVKLQWTVSEAKGFSHFVVERSADAIHFTQLATVDFDKNKKTYAFTDSPYTAESAPARYYYYRLQQVDEDDSFEYSTIRSVEAGKCDARLAIDFYPNPTQDEMNVKSYSPVQKLEIYNLAGKQMYQLTPGLNETEVKVNVQAFAQGIYIVNVINQEGKHTSKILKR